MHSSSLTYMKETGFAYLRNMLVKVKSLSKTTSRLQTVSDGNVLLPSSLTGKLADDPISLLLSANNNKVCFIWIKL